MNIRRGLFRLWIITAATWVGVLIVFWWVEEGIIPWIILVAIIGPPVAALAIGKAVFWIVGGFKEAPTSNKDITEQRGGDVSR